MKTLLLIITALTFNLKITAQTDFKWDITDSVTKTKAQIYSDSKVYIAKTWNSAKDVIQNDDKDGGIILIKGVIIKNVSFMMGSYRYVYNYNVTFKMKDNKFKVIIDNVYCQSAIFNKNGSSVTLINPFDGDNCPETGTLSKPGINKTKAIEMMASIKKDLQFIVDDYKGFIKTSKPSSDW